MTSTPGLLSVIIPVYNHANDLIFCLQSLSNQTFKNFEVIIVDDGSTDNPEAIFADAQKMFSRCTVLRQKNHGAPHARNTGAAQALGEFLLFLDADCTLRPDALEQFLYAFEQHPKASFSYSAFYFGWKLMHGVPFSKETLKQYNYIHTSSVVRRTAFPGFDESLKKFQDWDLWLTIAQRGGTGVLIEQPLFSIKPRKLGMSRWLPAFMYTLPWERLGWAPQAVTAYKEGQQHIKTKHHIA
jgi:glycosyltransferase involved in cell wall biosynthesis